MCEKDVVSNSRKKELLNIVEPVDKLEKEHLVLSSSLASYRSSSKYTNLNDADLERARAKEDICEAC